MTLLERLAPCPSIDAVLALLDAGLMHTPIHPGGVLSLARWYGVPTSLRIEAHGAGTAVAAGRGPKPPGELRRLRVALGRRGHLNLAELQHVEANTLRQVEFALDRDGRVQRNGALVLRVDDRASGLCRQVVRMLVCSPRSLRLDELLEGLARNWRFRRQHIPDETTLAAWVAVQPWLRRRGRRVALHGALTPEQQQMAVSAGTRELNRTLAAGGGSTSWAELVAALTNAGFLVETAKIAVLTSPIVCPVARDRYTLLGR